MARIPLERQDLPDDVRRLFETIWQTVDPADAVGAVECSPPLDVLESEAGVDVLVDLPGISQESLQVVFARNTLLIAGRKRPPACDHRHEAAFHVAERTFGRFARIVSLEGSFDADRAVATLSAGELRISLPRIEDRRGREIRIAVRV
ncbi:MAG TPA: Hsp20/alpha crystallin family protein [Vicinamibacterales bacterium]